MPPKDVTPKKNKQAPEAAETTDIVLAPEVQELSIESVVSQVAKVQNLMKRVLKKNEHYGVIPGTNKNTLYKSGAEKIGLTFRVATKIHETTTDLGDDHRDFSYRVELYHAPSSLFLGEGVGSASTKESKYRYRWETIGTGVAPPHQYLKTGKRELLVSTLREKKKKIPNDVAEITVIKNNEGRNEIAFKRKGENRDIADVYNTVRKMGKKRAYVDAIITAFSLSDMFTQDLEETQEANK